MSLTTFRFFTVRVPVFGSKSRSFDLKRGSAPATLRLSTVIVLAAILSAFTDVFTVRPLVFRLSIFAFGAFTLPLESTKKFDELTTTWSSLTYNS